jgi:hypothetical protein
MLNYIREKFSSFTKTDRHIAPLAVLRMAFGSIMLVSVVRFLLKGWVYAFYIKPKYHFTFYGFDWVRPLGATGMYLLFAILIITSILVTIGWFYRIAITTFFVCFTYVELVDKTTYLNHYYFISVMAFLMILVPANRYFSVDVVRKPNLKITYVPWWTIDIFKLQLFIVYFFAGLSKLNYDWLIAAMPLRIWLPANSHLPIIGGLLTQLWVAYVFSWFGALFDLCIGFLLINSTTRKFGYLLVVVFHLATAWFFKIGMFPYVMIFVTIVFFSENTHRKIIGYLNRLFAKANTIDNKVAFYQISLPKKRIICLLLLVHFSIQLFLPFRYLLYPGKLYWTEEGYRFSWRVMLMEKGGTAFFHVKDPLTGKRTEINNSQYLTDFQESQMSTQPDMILQFAHILAADYQQKGIKNPIVTAESYVTLNGSGSRLYIDTTVNLANVHDGFCHKKWILPFHNNN